MIDVEYRNQHGEQVGVESYAGFGYRRVGYAHARLRPGAQRPGARRTLAVRRQRHPGRPRRVSASRDWRPMHHDYDFAVNRQGVEGHLPQHPNQAAWFERYLTDWTGPKGVSAA